MHLSIRETQEETRGSGDLNYRAWPNTAELGQRRTIMHTVSN